MIFFARAAADLGSLFILFCLIVWPLIMLHEDRHH